MKPCRICKTSAPQIHTVPGRLDSRTYALHRCDACGYLFIAEPRTDFETIYDERYYRGEGSDPTLAYVHEHENFETTIHHYEWDAVLDILTHLGAKSDSPILDFGCGSGGFVRAARRRGFTRVFGFDEGWLFRKTCHEVYFLKREELKPRRFEFVVAIEVFEHLINPGEQLREIRSLLEPQGRLFLTTGNASKFVSKLSTWTYAQSPEVHVGFFEPRTLRALLEKESFSIAPQIPVGFYAGLFQYKILKVLGIKNRNPIFSWLPWKLLARLLNRRFGIADIPVGIMEATRV
jgi:SAM-dependent methyltransferase